MLQERASARQTGNGGGREGDGGGSGLSADKQQAINVFATGIVAALTDDRRMIIITITYALVRIKVVTSRILTCKPLAIFSCGRKSANHLCTLCFRSR